jgi:hypothetical protein
MVSATLALYGQNLHGVSHTAQSSNYRRITCNLSRRADSAEIIHTFCKQNYCPLQTSVSVNFISNTRHLQNTLLNYQTILRGIRFDFCYKIQVINITSKFRYLNLSYADSTQPKHEQRICHNILINTVLPYTWSSKPPVLLVRPRRVH